MEDKNLDNYKSSFVSCPSNFEKSSASQTATEIKGIKILLVELKIRINMGSIRVCQ
jgi:hypothetical protein